MRNVVSGGPFIRTSDSLEKKNSNERFPGSSKGNQRKCTHVNNFCLFFFLITLCNISAHGNMYMIWHRTPSTPANLSLDFTDHVSAALACSSSRERSITMLILSYLKWSVSCNRSSLPSHLSPQLFFHKLSLSLWPSFEVPVCCAAFTKQSTKDLNYLNFFPTTTALPEGTFGSMQQLVGEAADHTAIYDSKSYMMCTNPCKCF